LFRIIVILNLASLNISLTKFKIMILSEEFWKKNLDKMIKRPYNYVVLDSSSYDYPDDKDMLSPGIGIINLCNTLRMMNSLFEEIGNTERIDFSIMGNVLTAIYTDTPFDDKQLEDFFIFNRKLEKLARAFTAISHMMEHVYVSGDVVMLLIGFNLKKQKMFKEMDDGFIEEKFYTLHSKAMNDEMSVNNFKKAALKLLETGLVKANKKKIL